MGAVKQFIELKIQSKTGVNATVVIGLVVALFATVVAFVFAPAIAFIWLAGRYCLLTAALALLGLFLVVAVVAAFVALQTPRSTVATAEKALAGQSALSFIQPTHLKTALPIANGIGWRRLLPIVGVGFSRPASLVNSAYATE
jgi:hypothetical protein